MLVTVAQYTHQFCGGVGETGSSTGDQVNMTRKIELPDLDLFHPTALDFPLHAHARNDRDADTHLYKALDALDGWHFDGHIQGGAISRKKLDDAATVGGL